MRSGKLIYQIKTKFEPLSWDSLPFNHCPFYTVYPYASLCQYYESIIHSFLLLIYFNNTGFTLIFALGKTLCEGHKIRKFGWLARLLCLGVGVTVRLAVCSAQISGISRDSGIRVREQKSILRLTLSATQGTTVHLLQVPPVPLRDHGAPTTGTPCPLKGPRSTYYRYPLSP